jgi:hypothetical protein
VALQVLGKRHAVSQLRNPTDILVEPQVSAQGERAGSQFGGVGVRAADFPPVGVVGREKSEEQRATGDRGAERSATRHEWSECTVNACGDYVVDTEGTCQQAVSWSRVSPQRWRCP